MNRECVHSTFHCWNCRQARVYKAVISLELDGDWKILKCLHKPSGLLQGLLPAVCCIPILACGFAPAWEVWVLATS